MSFKLTDWKIEEHKVTEPSYNFPKYLHWYKYILPEQPYIFTPPTIFNSDVFVSVTPNFSTTDTTYSFPVWSVYWRDSKLSTLYYKNPCQKNDPEKIKEAVDQFLDRVSKILSFI
jgi:hypothetical protein